MTSKEIAPVGSKKALVAAPGRGLAIYGNVVRGIAKALKIGHWCGQYDHHSYSHNAVDHARKDRNQQIALFELADQAKHFLRKQLRMPLDRETSTAMVSALLGGFRTKPDKAALAAMLDMLENDELANAWRMCARDSIERPWRPLYACPAGLAIACRKLIATARFAPHPSELHAEVHKIQEQLKRTEKNCEALVESVRIADAVMLEFAPREEWFGPWRSRRTALERMLDLHDIYGDSRKRECYDDDDKLTVFGALVEREKLALLPAPKQSKLIADQKLNGSAAPQASHADVTEATDVQG
jgi:hypothetical protein